jgi:hopanoid-associated phosphorylase
MSRRGTLVVAGLAFEARLAASTGAIVCHGRGLRLRDSLAQAVAGGCAGIVSFGIAGGLDPRLPVGTPVIASAVVDGKDALPTDGRWSSHLLRTFPGAQYGRVLGSDEPVAGVGAKGSAFRRTGAVVVDMESHLAATAARRLGVPLAVVRVVADPAGRMVPEWALDAMRPDGSADALAVLRAAARRPAELRHLLALARDVWIARSVLARACRLFDASFGLLDAEAPVEASATADAPIGAAEVVAVAAVLDASL